MVYLLCGTVLVKTSFASRTYGGYESVATWKDPSSWTGDFGTLDGFPSFKVKTPSFVKYNLSTLPK